jgi:hypothetical protein
MQLGSRLRGSRGKFIATTTIKDAATHIYRHITRQLTPSPRRRGPKLTCSRRRGPKLTCPRRRGLFRKLGSRLRGSGGGIVLVVASLTPSPRRRGPNLTCPRRGPKLTCPRRRGPKLTCSRRRGPKLTCLRRRGLFRKLGSRLRGSGGVLFYWSLV